MIETYIQDVGTYSAVVIAVVEIIKRAMGSYIPERFYPLVSLTTGTLLGVFALGWTLLQSMIIGLVASGFYKLTKDTVIEIKSRM